MVTVAPIPPGIPEYSRSQWKHWTDADKDCQDARQEVLVAESLVDVSFESDRRCRVDTGRWYAAFTRTYVEVPGNLDIDHLVPLLNAHNSGGWDWSSERREEYANYLGDDAHLIAVTSRANRSKGARGPEEWKPPDATYWCQYATDWTEIKTRWELTMTEPEAEAVIEMLEWCGNPPAVEVNVAGTPKPAEPGLGPETPAYGSCEEAEAAGEQRVQGSNGSGKGYPEAMVPSARDGDGDGVVCES